MFELSIMTATLIAAIWIGSLQVSINNSLLSFNYEPSLFLSYIRPENNLTELVSGLQLTNNGKSSITYYQNFITTDSNAAPEEITVDNSGPSVIPANGGSVLLIGKDILSNFSPNIGDNGSKDFPLYLFFKTANQEKYILVTILKVIGPSQNGNVVIGFGPITYRKFNWLEK